MVLDLMTSPQGHQFDPRVKTLLAFCSAHHPHQFFFVVACPIHVSNSHTKFGLIPSNGLGGDGITDIWTNGRR